ncbi:hypothetical protein [Endozoicomonas sp. ONNA2]|uniref:hypothetical protein n=1 Tax=Endozoicomonas sp. ONNA2 TaxID=2828741 RepID=UPI002147753E|nr:hypothetical protein [Endozoicomonas sp. ONNA2]
MNALSVKTSACLNSQPQPGTQSVKASSQWTTTEPTKLLAPHPREGERRELLLAAQSGSLAIRRIDFCKEKPYLTGKGTPRPFSLALPGRMTPTAPLLEGYGEWMIGIVNPQCLYVYKHHVGTQDLKRYDSDAAPENLAENLKVKLLPDLQSLLDKRVEYANRKWDVYPLATSGHLLANGTFSLPKRKFSDATLSHDFPELVLTHYGKDDIKCFCVYHDTQTHIADILHDKLQCEEQLALEPLPLVVYCHRTGSVQVYFDDELSLPPELIGRSLGNFAFSQNLDPIHFRAMLNLLPMPVRAEVLNSELNVSPQAMHTLQQAIELVSTPLCCSYEKLLELKQSGLPIHQSFFHKGCVTSLLEMLLLRVFVYKSHEQTQKQVETAYRIFLLLLHSGASLTKDMCQSCIYYQMTMLRSFHTMPLDIINCLLVVFSPLECLTLLHLRRLPLTVCPGAVVEFDRICQKLSPQQRQNVLEEIIREYGLDPRSPTLDVVQSQLLVLFHYEACPDKQILHGVKRFLEFDYGKKKNVIGHFSVADFIEWVETLWKQRETYPFFHNWPKHVQWAEQEIAVLKQSLPLEDSGASATPPATETPAALQFVVKAFSKPPVLPDPVGDNEPTILTVLQNYYRRPGPERVIQSLGCKTMPTVWKPEHSCSHVLRARNNGLWYMELLEKFQQCCLREDEKELLALAIIYHDAAAEDVAKSAEETRSAHYFMGDLTGRYPKQLLGDMALAMASKENDVNGGDAPNLSDSVRWYLRILRFADRMDFIRGCCGIGADFPGLTATRHEGFDARRLDLPPQLSNEFTSGNKTEFQRHLEAAMHGAADLARITTQLQDHRKKDYIKVYGLNDLGGSGISEKFEWTSEPVQRMNQFIDDNVRRKIAMEAGIIVCSDPGHQACKPDQNRGITYGIHNSWYDLRQVAIPANMTLLEKMQYEHDPSLLSPATKQALAQEVQRLKNNGIRMNPGTLTQNTLDSAKAQDVLKRRGIAVVSEKRPYWTDYDLWKERKILVPKKIRKLDVHSTVTDQGES